METIGYQIKFQTLKEGRVLVNFLFYLINILYNLQIFLFIYTVILQVEFYPTFLAMSFIKYLHSFLNKFKCFSNLLFFIAAIIIVEWLTVSIKINQCN